MSSLRTAILHYTAPPIVGGVEAVIQAHIDVFVRREIPVTVLAGRGQPDALPEGAELHLDPLLDSQHPDVVEMTESLMNGIVPDDFSEMTRVLHERLAPVLVDVPNIIVHNLFTKHYNLPLTAALHRLLDEGALRNFIAWSHDFSWTSPNASEQVHAGYPWDLLRTPRPDVTYVVVSELRRQELADLFVAPAEDIQVVYNGVDPRVLYGLSDVGRSLVERLDLLDCDLLLIMPVRVTRAKNIEYALELLAAMKSEGAAPKLLLTGPPDPHDPDNLAYFQSLQQRRDELGLEEAMLFVYESGPGGQEGFTLDMDVVGELIRMADVMFMPSHREGFGMPVLEAGLLGVPVWSTAVPSALEIGGDDVMGFNLEDRPGHLASRMLDWAGSRPDLRLKRRVRSRYTWDSIFERGIRPLLQPPPPESDNDSR